VALIRTDYEEGRLQPTPAGQPPAGHPTLLLSPRYFERKKNTKKIIEIDEKRLRKKVAIRQTMKKGDCSQPQLAIPRANYFLLDLSSYFPPSAFFCCHM
jgi:hypothetical protein